MSRLIVRAAAALIALVFTLTLPAVALAHDGHPHKILGTVSSATTDQLVIKTKDGKEQTITIAATTKILKDKATATATDLAPGARVVVTAVTSKGVATAKEIRIGVAAAAKPAAKPAT
jgi:glycine betaine/choline ABC-type transport system substrate-binding protein